MSGEYIYCGRIELVSKLYTEIQPGENVNDRNVWMFYVRTVPGNDIKKPQMFVLRIWMTIRHVGKNVDA